MFEREPLLIVAAIGGTAVLLVAVYVVGVRLMRSLPPMLPVPVQTLFNYSALFTVGIALLSTRASLLMPFGLVFAFVGLAVFLPEKVAVRLLGFFLLLLVIALLSVLQRLRSGDPLIRPEQLTVFSAGGFALIWGLGMLFAWRRWWSGRTQVS